LKLIEHQRWRRRAARERAKALFSYFLHWTGQAKEHGSPVLRGDEGRVNFLQIAYSLQSETASVSVVTILPVGEAKEMLDSPLIVPLSQAKDTVPVPESKTFPCRAIPAFGMVIAVFQVNFS
jgi:hypothetical protein